MRLQSVQLASHPQIASIGPFTVTSPSTSTLHDKELRVARKKPVLGGIRAILISALVGSAVWYMIWEIGKFLLFRH